MRKVSIFVLGYGLAYGILALLALSMPIPTTLIFTLNVASFIFFLGEFCDKGLKTIKLCILFLATVISNSLLIECSKLYNHFTDRYIENSSTRNPPQITKQLCRIECFLSTSLLKKARSLLLDDHKISSLSAFLYILFPIALVITPVLATNDLSDFSSLSNFMQLLPFSVLFINLFFDNEWSNIVKIFMRRLHEATAEINEISEKTSRIGEETDIVRKNL